MFLGTVALVGTVTGAVIGIWRKIRAMQKRRRELLLEKQFASVIRGMVRGLRVGIGVRQTLVYAGKESPEPMATAFRQIIQALAIGRSMEEAMDPFAAQMPFGEAKIFAAAVRITQTSGGSLGNVLETLAESMALKESHRQKLASATAQGLASAYVLSTVPLLVLVGLYLIAPEMTVPVFHSQVGHGLLAGVLVLMAAGSFFAERIATPPEVL